MSDFDKVAVIGDADFVFGLRALGLHVFSPQDAVEARTFMGRIEKEKYALCLVHDRWLETLHEERQGLRKKWGPVVVGFSDYRSLTDQVDRLVKEVAVRAIGSDSLIKRKGYHE